MKKFAKMSLVAAVAVAGLSSTVSAKDLSEAIQGVDVSGTAVYRYNDYGDDKDNAAGKDTTQNYYKLVVNVKAPINDDLAFNTSVAANNGFGAWDTSTTGDSNPGIELTKINFQYSGIKNTTVKVGKDGVTSPWTVASDSDGAEQTGTGIAASSNLGPVTLVAAYYNQTNFGTTIRTADGSAGADYVYLGAMATFAGIGLEAQYADQLNQLDSYTLAAKYTIKTDSVKVALSARHTELEEDKATTKNKLTKAAVVAKMGMFGGFIKYGKTGKDGGDVAFDASAKTAMEGWNTNLSGQADADYTQLGINAQVLPTFNVALNHFERKDKTSVTANDAKELYFQFTYKPGKNFYTYVRLGQYEANNSNKSDMGRLQVQYTF